MRNSLRLFTIRDKLLILVILISGCKVEAQDFEARNNPVAENYRYSLYFSDYTIYKYLGKKDQIIGACLAGSIAENLNGYTLKMKNGDFQVWYEIECGSQKGFVNIEPFTHPIKSGTLQYLTRHKAEFLAAYSVSKEISGEYRNGTQILHVRLYEDAKSFSLSFDDGWEGESTFKVTKVAGGTYRFENEGNSFLAEVSDGIIQFSINRATDDKVRWLENKQWARVVE